MDGLGASVEDRSVYGVENSSMFLECSPKSQRALIYWQLQKPNDDRKHEVRPPPRNPPTTTTITAPKATPFLLPLRRLESFGLFRLAAMEAFD